MSDSTLKFEKNIPIAPHGLGGLVRDHFGNGRLFVTVSAHGGLSKVSYWGRQPLGAVQFFQGDPESSWVKLFRVYAGIREERHYLKLNDTRLFPFGYSSQAEIGGIGLTHQMLLLPDAVVHRLQADRNPLKQAVRIEVLHQEAGTGVSGGNRVWKDLEFIPPLNALIASCTDRNPEPSRKGDDGSLAQKNSPLMVTEVREVTTWIGIGGDSRVESRRGLHARSKHYLAATKQRENGGAMFLVFAHSRQELEARLAGLKNTVHDECDGLLYGYEERQRSRPQIDTGNKVLNSAFSQYPEIISHMKVPDRPGALKATLAGYGVWGWDGLTAPFACDLANEPESAADILRFYQDTSHKDIGIPHAYSSTFQPLLKGPFPAQAQFIAALYHHVSITGDLSPASELMPTCRMIIDRCRERLVKRTGLVEGNALWPDFPEAMEENGHDVSSMNNSLLYQGLRCMEFLARSLGNCSLAEECREWAAILRKSFVKYLFDPEKGFFLSSCDSRTLKSRKHYCAQAVFWLTPFARELVSHAPGQIADFMNKELRSKNCLLTLPHWDTAWMADGNQLGSSFPAADHFYLNSQKLVANSAGLKRWLADVEWFWRHHTVPEAFTPEAENEADFGTDNAGCKQLQACSTWYVGLFTGLAGLDFDHEGITFTPWGDAELCIKQLRLHGFSLALKIHGTGNHIGSLILNEKIRALGSHKISWSEFKGKRVRIELVRSRKTPRCPVIVRADGLRVDVVECEKGLLSATVDGTMSGEVIVQAGSAASVILDGAKFPVQHEPSAGTITIPFRPGKRRSFSVVIPH